MHFEDFLHLIPDAGGRVPITEVKGGFRYVDKGIPEFVGPDLAPATSVDQPKSSQIIIVSASGAAGKSTLANEVARAKRAPIWDLAHADAVGTNSLTGQISTSFGLAEASTVFKALSDGSLALIIDALDEARVKTNEAGFEAFISDIAKVAKGSTATCFVLLARTQTAHDTWLFLEEAGIRPRLLAIQPFTRAQAERYIDARIRHDQDTSAARRIDEHRGPFIEVRDAILNQLERAVVGGHAAKADSASREFLGYAPVLETVAVLLIKERNPHELLADLKTADGSSGSGSERPLAMLEHVVTRLLAREQKQKLQHNIRPALESTAASAGWSSWESLYSPQEQQLRLLGRVLGRRIDACPEMPVAVRAKYEEQLQMFLGEHPFLRDARTTANKVFESYLFAAGMREYLTDLSKAIEARVSSPDYRPSRLLSDFYLLFGRRSGDGDIAERQIGLLYESMLAGETESLRVRLSIDAGDPDDTSEDDDAAHGEFELIYYKAEATGDPEIERRVFKIVSGDGSLSIRRQLKEATITTKGAVTLGAGTDDFEIGPSVDINCGVLHLPCSGITVRGRMSGGAEDDLVTLAAESCESAVLRKPVVRGRLAVSWLGSDAYPWSDFSSEIARVSHPDHRMHEVQRRFRRIVGGFASHSKGSLAKYRAKVEGRRVLKNEMGQRLLEVLVSEGILRLVGDFYHWVPRRADEALGISFDDIRNRRWSTNALDFFQTFITKNEHLF